MKPMLETSGTASIREHQMVMLELLKQVDSICRKYGISYSLFSGSLLGAVRHAGFVPWDDDLDLIFLREDYERFLNIAEKELDPSLYYVQREFSEHWPMQSSKIRRNNTACIEKFRPKDSKMHRGIYIDLFPCDSLSNNNLIAMLQFFASKIVIAKALDARGYETHSYLKKIILVMSRLLPRNPFLRVVQLGRQTNTERVHSFLGGSSRYEKSVFPRKWFQELQRMPFEDGIYPVPVESDALLKILYGDYMKIPSEEEQAIKKHAFLVDTNRSYSEYTGVEKTMNFKVLTRSIR